MTGRRAQLAATAQRLRSDGGGGEGLSLVAIAREMGISVSYASALLSDPTGEIDLSRKRWYYKHSKKKRKPARWTEANIIEAIREWEIEHGRPPTCPEWSRRDSLPEWAPTVGVVFRVFGKGGWNKAIAAAGFTPRPAHAPEYVQNTAGNQIAPVRPEVREAMSVERKALYAANPDHPMFAGLKEGWDISYQQRQRSLRRHVARQQSSR